MEFPQLSLYDHYDVLSFSGPMFCYNWLPMISINNSSENSVVPGVRVFFFERESLESVSCCRRQLAHSLSAHSADFKAGH